MGRKYPRSEDNHRIVTMGDDAYVMLGEGDSMDKAMASLTQATEEYSGKVYASRTSLRDIGGGGISGRHGFTQFDYEMWRPGEQSRFFNIKETMMAADHCYKNHGLIRNIIDLMGDFACQGIRLVHPNKRIEKFYQNWFDKVNGKERSERFLNYLYRMGNVVVRMQTAKPSPKSKERLFKTMASIAKEQAEGADINMEDMRFKIDNGEIPIKYTFLHPVTIDVVGGALSNFVGKPRYVIKIPDRLRRIILKPRNATEKNIVAQIPAEIKKAAKSRKGIPLPEDKTRVYHYRKDDWAEWAEPMIGGILLDISLYEKLKLADRAALDGAISNIRIFKLGSLEHKIIPTDKAAAKLASILEANTNAGTLDLIWGPDIELIESKTTVHQFLGMTKYEPTLLAIYAGVGIPPTLTGTFGASGTTNNFISLKTFIKRLEYGREILISFWNEQLRMIQEQMGFRFPAKVEFDFDDLGDEASEKALLIQLADRDLVSQEFLQRRFKHDPEMEKVRIKRDKQDRDKGRMPDKAGPFHDPQMDEQLKKVALQTGVVTPSQVGVELKPNKKGEVPAIKMKPQPTGPGGKGGAPPGKKGTPGQGRPKNSKDSGPRKQKEFKPKTKAAFELWAANAQSKIDDIMNPVILETKDKKSMRSLSSKEAEEAEIAKFAALCNLNPFEEVTVESVYNSLEHNLPNGTINIYKEMQAAASADLGRKLNIDERKRLQVIIYENIQGENNG